MNGSRAGWSICSTGIKAGMAHVNAAEVAVCPPSCSSRGGARLQGTAGRLGRTEPVDARQRAYTGEVAASMLTDFAAST